MATRIPEQVLESVEKYKDKILKEEQEVENVYIYGSYVKGNYTEDSDIDLAIVINKNDSNLNEKVVKYMLYTWKIDTRIEPHVFIKEELENDMFWGSIKNELYKIA